MQSFSELQGRKLTVSIQLSKAAPLCHPREFGVVGMLSREMCVTMKVHHLNTNSGEKEPDSPFPHYSLGVLKKSAKVDGDAVAYYGMDCNTIVSNGTNER